MRLIGLLATAVLVAACSAGAQPGGTTSSGATTRPGATTGAGQTAATGTQAPGGGTGGSLFDKAKAVKHFCDLLPTELVPAIIASPAPPQEAQFPPGCTVFGDKTAMAISLGSYNPIGTPPADATPIPGLGTGAYLERLSPGNFSLWVGLSPEGGTLYLEVNNSDGKDHTDEVVNVAKSVLQKLGG